MDLNCQPGTRGSHWRAYLWLFFILALVTVIRLRLVNLPLERDEGEFAYGGQLMLQGTSIYQGAYNDALKLPGTCGAYALVMGLFGQTTAAIHMAVIGITLATAIFVFLLTRRLCGDGAGVIAAGAYALLAISPPSFGLAAHATHFVMLPALAGIFLLQNLDVRTSARRIFSAGLLLGLALLMKQTGAVFGLFAAIWLTRCEMVSPEKNVRRLVRRLVWLALGGLLPFALTCLLIAGAGDWPQFWHWTFQYAGAHAKVISFTEGLGTAARVMAQLFFAATALWCLALVGMVLLWVTPALRTSRFFIAGFALCSLAAAYPGWRGHYFIQFFPALGLLAGVAFHAVWPLLARLNLAIPPNRLIYPVFGIACMNPLLQSWPIFFTLTPDQVSRAIYTTNPFPETVVVARYLARNCPSPDRVAVLGSEPQIYFYSHRRAATGYISTYPLMEAQPYALAMQREMIREIERADPEYVVFVHVPGSWLQHANSQTLIFDWFEKYRQQHLNLVGFIEIPDDGPSVYHWFDTGQTNLATTAKCWLAIFRKK